MAEDTTELTIDGPDGSDTLTIPDGLVDLLREDEEPAAAIVGDVALFGLAQRVHAAVHHAEGDVNEELEAAEETTMSLFEERFGVTYGEATGHSH